MYFRCVVTNDLSFRDMFSSILMGWWNLLMPSHGVLMIPFPWDGSHIWILILTSLLLNWEPTHFGQGTKTISFLNFLLLIEFFYTRVMVEVKLQCASIVELDHYFLSHEFMNAFKVVYPHNWMGPKPETSFWLHLNVINKCFLCVKKMWL